jgi:hypothetical protein
MDLLLAIPKWKAAGFIENFRCNHCSMIFTAKIDGELKEIRYCMNVYSIKEIKESLIKILKIKI